MILTSNSDVTVTQYNDYYIMDNSHLLLNLTRAGTSSSYAPLSSEDMINIIHFKDENKTMTDSFALKIDDVAVTGTGYSYAMGTGVDMNRGEIVYIMNFTLGSGDYSMHAHFKLETGADFITTEVTNFNRNS